MDSAHDVKPPVTPERLEAHRRMVQFLFYSVAGVCLLMGACLLSAAIWDKSSILFLVVLAGALGALVNSLRRLFAYDEQFPRQEYVGLFLDGNSYLITYSLAPVVIGMIAAAVIYTAFAGELLSGAVFPKFDCRCDDCGTLKQIMNNWAPDEAADYAKSVVWGFISGFSEQFFVHSLDQFVNKEK